MEQNSTFIPYSRAWITSEDILAVNNILSGGKVSQGSVTAAFEKQLCQAVGALGGGVGVSSGTAALMLALWALDIGQRDEVLTSSYVCQEVIDAIVSTGATPVFCDIGSEWVMKPDNVQVHITPKSRAIIVPHMFGIFAKIPEFRRLGLPIIEDCSQALALAPDWQISGDIATFSFRWSKCITTGEGGMAVSSNQDLLRKMVDLRDGQINRPALRLTAPLSDLASALGLSQLHRYQDFLTRRKQFANKYRERLNSVNPSLLEDYPYERSMFYRLAIKIPGGWRKHHKLFLQRGIETNQGVLYLQHRNYSLSDDNFKKSVESLNQTIILPIYPNITGNELVYCVNTVLDVVQSIFVR